MELWAGWNLIAGENTFDVAFGESLHQLPGGLWQFQGSELVVFSIALPVEPYIIRSAVVGSNETHA